jgi:hypothetical protein
MIPTLRANNGSFASLGNVHLQPVAVNVAPTKQQLQPQHSIAVGGALPSQAVLKLPVLLHNQATSVSHISTPTLSTVATLVSSNPHTVIPLPIRGGVILPSYHLQLQAGKEFDPRTVQGFATTTTKFQPYEQVTGLAQERPEVVMVTNLEPLFDNVLGAGIQRFVPLVDAAKGLSANMTSAGLYLDSQIQLRNLRSFSASTLVKSIKLAFPGFSQQMSQRTDDFTNALNELNADAAFLLNLVRVIESQKAQLDLRHDLYTVDPNQAGTLYLNTSTQEVLNLGPSLPPIKLQLTTKHKPKYDFVDTLADLGYKATTVQTVYASTKVWMQLLLELSYALRFHTLQLIDIDPSFQRNDTNPSTILDPKVTRFSLSTNLPTLPKLDELISLQPTEAQQAISAIKPAFQTLYQNVTFKDEEARIAALAHLLSSEHRYSRGLSLPQVQRALKDFYGFTVNTSPGVANSSVFDFVIGKFGNNISDFPAQSTHALASVGQQVAGSTGILTFETKYVEGDTGTLSPGGDFYFDQILDDSNGSFNTSNMEALISVLDTSLSSFNVIVDGMNLLSQPASRGAIFGLLGGATDHSSGILATAGDVINAVKEKLLDTNGNTS